MDQARAFRNSACPSPAAFHADSPGDLPLIIPYPKRREVCHSGDELPSD